MWVVVIILSSSGTGTGGTLYSPFPGPKSQVPVPALDKNKKTKTSKVGSLMYVHLCVHVRDNPLKSKPACKSQMLERLEAKP